MVTDTPLGMFDWIGLCIKLANKFFYKHDELYVTVYSVYLYEKLHWDHDCSWYQL